MTLLKQDNFLDVGEFVKKCSEKGGIYLLKVNNRNNKNAWRRFAAFIVNFEHISQLVLVLLLLNLNR